MPDRGCWHIADAAEKERASERGGKKTEIQGTVSTHRILLEQLTVFQLFNIFHALCEIISLITAFTRFRYLIRAKPLNLSL
jgi:hypothetical protein